MFNAVQMLTDEELTRSEVPPGGFGALQTRRGALPLVAMRVQVSITGLISEVRLEQSFVNTTGEAIEATYIFPLPDRAGVTSFVMHVAGRRIEGVLQERGEARRAYDAAILRGERAAITEEERAGVFTLRAGNLMPGETATVELTLTGPLALGDGEATFRFPLVVAPRYMPGAPLPGASVGDGIAADTDAVPDASRISPPILLAGQPNPVRLSLEVALDPAGLSLSNIRSSLHVVRASSEGSRFSVKLEPGERLNRDFILRFSIARETVSASLRIEPDAGGSSGAFLLTLVPPSGPAHTRPRDVVFILDRSGSMRGWKMVAARRAVARMVDTLTDRDRFTVIAFDDQVEFPAESPGGALMAASDRHRFQAVEMLAKIEARGGTELAAPLGVATSSLSASTAGIGERDRALVLVTDGQVGNEDQLLRLIAPKLHGTRVFTLGIDRAVNAAFLQRLAGLGGGSSELVESEDRLDEVMDRFHRRLGTPVLTELRLAGDGLELVPDSIVPSRLPDLFEGAPVLISGRWRGTPGGAITAYASDATGARWTERLEAQSVAGQALGVIWARGRVRELEDRYAIGRGDRAALSKEIVATSLAHGVLSRFTAFVAIDSSERVNPGGAVNRVVQPVEPADGWDMLGSGGGGAPAMMAPKGGIAAAAPMAMDQAAPRRARAELESKAEVQLEGRAQSFAPPPVQQAPAPARAKRRAPEPSAAAAGDPVEAYRLRLDRLVVSAREGLARARDDGDRLHVLGVLRMGLRALLEDLRSVGLGGAFEQQIAALLGALDTALDGTAPIDPAAVWNDVQRRLAGITPPPAPGGRDAFWK